MNNIFRNSFPFKLFLMLCNYYKMGAVCKGFDNFKQYYKSSKTKEIWQGFVLKESAVYSSSYAKFCGKIADFLIAIGDVYKKSILCKIFNFIVNNLCKITESSVFFAPFRWLGFKGFLIMTFGLYLPIDYVLRSVLKISILASVWDELLFLLFFVVIIYKIATKTTTNVSKITPLDAYIYMFLSAGLFLMCFICPIFSIAFDGYRAVVQYILWFFLLTRLIEDDKDFKILYTTLVSIIIVLGLHGIYQFIIGVEIPATWMTQSEEAVRTRVFSITGSPNIMGAIIVLFTPMVTAYAYMTKNRKVQIIAWITTILLCFSLLFTFSKGAWVGMAVAIVIFAIFLDRRIISLLLMGGAFVVVAVPSVTSRITYLFTSDYKRASAIGGRTLRWATGIDLLNENNPFFGFGLGRFGGAVAMQNQVIETTENFSYFYMDNYYLKTLVEMGYMGLFFYVLMLVATVVLCIKALGRIYNTKLYTPCVAMFSGMCGVLVHCYFENIFEVPYMTAYFWAMSAMIMYAGFISNRKKI